MAIKVNGTTVIDDSRNLVNIVSGAGSSTTFGDVGTYTWGRPLSGTYYSGGNTASGLRAMATNWPYNTYWNGSVYENADYQSAALSGTWRSMNGSRNATSLWVRIS